jgi:hypothetical protein
LINLSDLSRVRLHGGTLVHVVNPGCPRKTNCGKRVVLTGPTGRVHDRPLPEGQVVTCHNCATEDG